MYSRLKPTVDCILALCLLLILAPLLLTIAVWIKVADPGPVLYRAERVGKGGRGFRMLKFRTMTVNADQNGPASTAGDDPRVTKPGRVLRRFKLDELPQLLNVARGEMSLVGPRPQVRWAVDLYSDDERRLLSVRPGITDFASLRFRDEAGILQGSTDPDRDYLRLIAPLKNKLALEYVQSISLSTDAKILLATALSAIGADPSWCLPPVASETARPERT